MENSNLYINNEGELCYNETTIKETLYVKSIFVRFNSFRYKESDLKSNLDLFPAGSKFFGKQDL